MEPAAADTAKDARFVQKWDRWQRLGWPAYVLWNVALAAAQAAVAAFCMRNLIERGWSLVTWYGPTAVDYAATAGVAFASVAIFLGRFSDNEARYKRLTQ